MSDIHALISKALLMLALILVALNIAGWMKKREFRYFGETAMCISVGLFVALVFRLLSFLFDADILHDVQLSTSFFYMVLLPPIIFEGGYSVHRTEFVKNLPLIFALAFIGGTFSTVVIALVMYLLSNLLSATPVSMVESLIFGALISSTDPVTILAMLPPETDRSLYMVIFGESALNDAVAIILYRFFSALADPALSLTIDQFFASLLESLWVFAGSFAVGAVTAMLYAKLTKHQKLTHEADIYEVTMMLVFAYASYLLAETLHMTGIISVFFCGITMAHYAKGNLADESILTAKKMLRVMSTVCEFFIFMYLGMGIVAFPQAKYNVLLIIVAIIAIALGRTHVFAICAFHNVAQNARVHLEAVSRLRIPGSNQSSPSRNAPVASRAVVPSAGSGNTVSFDKQLFVWFSGLRGAVAFALAVQLLDNEYLPADSRSRMFGTSIIVIVATVYGLNVLTPPLISILDITSRSNAGAGGASAAAATSDSASQEDTQPLPGVWGTLQSFDARYIQPFLCISHLQRQQRLQEAGHGHGHGHGHGGAAGANASQSNVSLDAKYAPIVELDGNSITSTAVFAPFSRVYSVPESPPPRSRQASGAASASAAMAAVPPTAATAAPRAPATVPATQVTAEMILEDLGNDSQNISLH